MKFWMNNQFVSIHPSSLLIMATLNIDRYHAAMGDASYKDATRLRDKSLSEAEASLAMQFRMAAGTRWLSDFSLRRNGDIERAVEVATYAFIGGFNDTSNMEAAHRLDIPAVGTEAHYWQQSYLEFMYEPETEQRTGKPKHFEQVAFERWLDANPNGTTLLLDTIDVHMGAVHAAMAVTSTEARRRAFKGFRVDSGDLAKLGVLCLRFLEANDWLVRMLILT